MSVKIMRVASRFACGLALGSVMGELPLKPVGIGGAAGDLVRTRVTCADLEQCGSALSPAAGG